MLVIYPGHCPLWLTRPGLCCLAPLGLTKIGIAGSYTPVIRTHDLDQMDVHCGARCLFGGSLGIALFYASYESEGTFGCAYKMVGGSYCDFAEPGNVFGR